MFDRRTFLLRSGAGIALAAVPASVQAAAPAPGGQPAPHQALAELLAGNRRFAADQAICPPHSRRRAELAAGQNPFAIVVSCSDSRVPVETIFDQPPGAVFGVRVAGNFVDEHGLGSIEYAVASFHSPLLLILGHTECGAVKATVEYVKNAAAQPPHIQSLIDATEPAAVATKGAGDWVAAATARNVRDTMAAVAVRSTIASDARGSGKLAIAGGIYDLHTGTVRIL
ncbi:MAG TPA: carbonic anhydrase, partial [Candidatus Aquilonibacter sp.]